MDKLNNKKTSLGKSKQAICVKLSDDNFKGLHPNGIFEGYTTMGEIKQKPEVGKSFEIGRPFSPDYLMTSKVTEVISDTNEEIKFKTINSTYLLKIIEDINE